MLIRKTVASNEGKSKKLLPKYSGPYAVKEILDHDRYLVTDLEGSTRSQKTYSGVHPVDKLKRYTLAETNGDETSDADTLASNTNHVTSSD